MKNTIFEGVATALVTPMNNDGSINFDRLKTLIDEQIDAGIPALVICGTTGESATMTLEEHSEVIRVAIKHAAGRIKIIAGEAQVTPEKAKKILDATFFYPPAQHAYVASICGRACDTACYMHLEEQGKLTKKFKRPFREREEWKFKIEDYK